MPDKARKCTVTLKQLTICLTGHALTIASTPIPPLKQLELFCENESATINNNKEIIVGAIQAGTTISVSDVSYKADIGTSAMILEAPTGERLTASMYVP